MKFSIQNISNDLKQQMIKTKVWKKSCPVSFEDLRLIIIEHYDFNDVIQKGEMVIHHKMAENAVSIFKELYDIKFPINKMKLINEYDGDDFKSMEDNNSSCFNYRKIPALTVISMHSYGLAIDINPAQNPFLIINQNSGTAKIFPKISANFLNRLNMRKGMVESVVDIFAKHGFDEWGGNWNSMLDYHHFQVKRELLPQYLGIKDEIIE